MENHFSADLIVSKQILLLYILSYLYHSFYVSNFKQNYFLFYLYYFYILSFRAYVHYVHQAIY